MKDVKITEVLMEDPTFEDGTQHIASIIFTNPKSQAVTYTATLYLAEPVDLTVPIVSSDEQSFTIPADSSSSPISFDIVMPLLAVATATFKACCLVSVSGVPVQMFVGSEDVIVEFSAAVGWGGITWD